MIKSLYEEVMYGNTCISFSITYRNRRTLSVEVHPDTSVHIVAPLEASVLNIKKKVVSKASWIVKQQHYFKPYLPLASEKEYVSGESYYYLGRQYRLKVIQAVSDTAKLKGKYLWVYVSDRTKISLIQKQIKEWYKQHAQIKFEERLPVVFQSFKRQGISMPQLSFKRMAKRWGSYLPGKMILNIKLVEAPIYCIDYVIAHELCHAKYPNHGKGFYQLLTRIMPDWEQRKERLEKVI
jgi:predicted metal-dependent hydrolase